MTPSGHETPFRDGLAVSPPLILASVPIGFLYGVAAAGIGVDPLQAVAMSVAMFTGAAQLVVVELVASDALPAIVVLAALVVNLRYLMYSASLAVYFRDVARRWRWLSAYLLLDVNYAITLDRFADVADPDVRRFYLGVSVPLWLTQQAAVVVGIVVGASVPGAWRLDFAVPLVFIGILVPAMKSRANVAAGLTAGTLAVALVVLPLNLGIVVSALVGTVVGALVQESEAT